MSSTDLLEEYAAYSGLLKDWYFGAPEWRYCPKEQRRWVDGEEGSEPWMPTQLVIQKNLTWGVLSRAHGLHELEAWAKSRPEITEDIRYDFWCKMESPPWELQPLFTVPVPYVLITEEELEEISSRARGSAWDFWREFYKCYPDAFGILSFSRVGFNQERNTALFYFGLQQASIVGRGQMILMRHVDGAWHFRASYTLWIS